MRARTLVAALGTRNIARASTPLFFGGFLRSPFGTTAAAAAAATTQRASVAMPVSTEAATTTAAKTPAHPIAAVAQLRSTSDKFRNLLDVAHCAGLARSRGASMLFLPECFGFMGESAEQTLREAEDPSRLEAAGGGGPGGELAAALEAAVRGAAAGTAPGGTTGVPSPPVDSLLDGLRTIARASGLWISGGGVHVSGAPPEDGSKEGRPRVYNTHVVLDADGALRASYQKIHLFDVSIPGKVDLRESRTTAPGTRLVVCNSPVGRLGVTTCYDMRFPEVYTELVGTMGAQVLLLPSAFTVPTGAAHWHTLLRARAIENQCYVLAAAQYGRHNARRDSFGHSLAVDPWGKILADAGGYPTAEEAETGQDDRTTPEPPSIVTAEIDLSRIDSIRQRMPIDLHRSSARF